LYQLPSSGIKRGRNPTQLDPLEQDPDDLMMEAVPASKTSCNLNINKAMETIQQMLSLLIFKPYSGGKFGTSNVKAAQFGVAV
jgi:hypothetical protein